MAVSRSVRFDWAEPEIVEIFEEVASFRYEARMAHYACSLALDGGGKLRAWADVAEVRKRLGELKAATREDAQEPETKRRRNGLRRKVPAASVPEEGLAFVEARRGFVKAVQECAGALWSPPFEQDPEAAARFTAYLRAMLLPRRRLVRGADNLMNIRVFTRPARFAAAAMAPLQPPADPEISVAAALEAYLVGRQAAGSDTQT